MRVYHARVEPRSIALEGNGQPGERNHPEEVLEEPRALPMCARHQMVLAPPPLPSRLLCQLDGCPACAVRVELRECGDYEEGGSRSVVRAQRVLEEVPVEQRLAEEFRLGSGEGG